ncbi:MAG: hypothetical protein A2007_04845 [Verrucomicrobia bacterium GWC2_42_7]|nr:MAG: hypothetical protein A2007_04845 [Verrucomicrobia bacterium GWC2_42_7]
MKHSFNDTLLSIFIDEDLVSTSVARIRQELLKIFENASLAQEVVVDVEHCSVIDSQGLNLLIALYKETTKRRLHFSVKGASPSTVRLFEIFKLKEPFGIKN